MNRCLFCPKIFSRAADKDDHILEHFRKFTQETCSKCDQNLIRIGKYLYTRHNEATCVKDHRAPCMGWRTADECVQLKTESDPLAFSEDVEKEISTHNDIGNQETERILPNHDEPMIHNEEQSTKESEESESIACKICGRDFDNEKTLNLHKIRSHKESGFTCPVCSKIFKEQRYLIHHMQHYHKLSVEKQKCPHLLCRFSFINKSDLDTHINTVHSKPNEIFCDKCAKTFPTTLQFKIHTKRAHAEVKPLKCRICLGNFKTEAMLMEHMDTQHQEGIDSSKEEGENSTGEDIINVMEPMIEIDTDFQIVNGPKQQMKCNECDRIFNQKKTLEYHKLRSHSKPAGFTCEICYKSFAKQRYLYAHLRVRHKSIQNTHKCPSCRKSFVNKLDLDDHVKAMHSEPGFVCEICEKVCPDLRLLKEHLRYKHKMNMKRVKCNSCHLTFINKSDLESHVNAVHLKSDKISHHNNLVCDKCGKYFEIIDLLQIHTTLMHSEEKPFKCQICSESFTEKLQLMKHALEKHPNADK